MTDFESKVKASLIEAAEQTPDYWEAISKKIKIPYKEKIMTKNTPKRNIFRLRYALPAVCGLALAALLIFISLPGDKLPPTGGEIIGTQTVEQLEINSVLSSSSAKIKLPDNGTTETLSYEAYLANVGMKLELWVPAEMKNTYDASVYYNEDGSEFMMSGFTFQNDTTGAYINIRFQKESLPITDVRYQFEEEKVSLINGEEIVIGYLEEIDSYMTAFMYKGIGYDVTSGQGVSREEFVQVIQSILQ